MKLLVFLFVCFEKTAPYGSLRAFSVGVECSDQIVLFCRLLEFLESFASPVELACPVSRTHSPKIQNSYPAAPFVKT